MSTRVGSSPTPAAQRIPPLQPGDHLTRDEFERRFDATPGQNKVELIEGVVFMTPPVSWGEHGHQHFQLMAWLTNYADDTPGILGADNTSVRLDLDNEPQPDGFLFIDPKVGGSMRIIGVYLEGAPEFVAEISASSASIDLNAKFRVYRRNGVREYIVWRVFDQAIDWFVLRGGNYERLQAGSDGVIRSEVLPGLWLSAEAFVQGDRKTVREVSRQGIGSAEHQDFVAKLQARCDCSE